MSRHIFSIKRTGSALLAATAIATGLGLVPVGAAFAAPTSAEASSFGDTWTTSCTTPNGYYKGEAEMVAQRSMATGKVDGVVTRYRISKKGGSTGHHKNNIDIHFDNTHAYSSDSMRGDNQWHDLNLKVTGATGDHGNVKFTFDRSVTYDATCTAVMVPRMTLEILRPIPTKTATTLDRSSSTVVPVTTVADDVFSGVEGDVTMQAPTGTKFKPLPSVPVQSSTDGGETWTNKGYAAVVGVSYEANDTKLTAHWSRGMTTVRGERLRFMPELEVLPSATPGALAGNLAYTLKGHNRDFSTQKFDIDSSIPVAADATPSSEALKYVAQSPTTLERGKATPTPVTMESTVAFDGVRGDVEMTAPAGTRFKALSTINVQSSSNGGKSWANKAYAAMTDVKYEGNNTKLTGTWNRGMVTVPGEQIRFMPELEVLPSANQNAFTGDVAYSAKGHNVKAPTQKFDIAASVAIKANTNLRSTTLGVYDVKATATDSVFFPGATGTISAERQSAPNTPVSMTKGDSFAYVYTLPAGLTAGKMTDSSSQYWKHSYTTQGNKVTHTVTRLSGSDASVFSGRDSIPVVGNKKLAAGQHVKVDFVAPAGHVSSSPTGSAAVAVDADAPSAPAGLTIKDITTHEATLGWTASEDSAPGSGVKDYTVRITKGAKKVLEQTTTGTSYKATGLDPATKYDVTVTARDNAGNVSGALKGEFTTKNDHRDTTLGVYDVKADAEGGVFVPGKKGTVSAARQIKSGTPVSMNEGDSFSYVYTLPEGLTVGDLKDSSGAYWSHSYTTEGNKVTHTVTRVSGSDDNAFPGGTERDSIPVVGNDKLAAGQQVTIDFIAPTDYVSSSPTGSTSILVGDWIAPSVPAPFTATWDDNAKHVNLDWNISTDNVGVDHYELKRADTNLTDVEASKTNAVDEFSTLGTHTYRVRAVDAAGNASDWASATVVIEDQTPPPAPTSLQFSWQADNTGLFTWEFPQAKVEKVDHFIMTFQAKTDLDGRPVDRAPVEVTVPIEAMQNANPKDPANVVLKSVFANKGDLVAWDYSYAVTLSAVDAAGHVGDPATSSTFITVTEKPLG